jgi:hypothetical protein
MEHMALTVPEVAEATVTYDGRVMILKAFQVNGEELKLAFPHETLPALIEVSAACFAQGSALQGAPENLIRAFKAASWAVVPANNSTAAVLTMTLENGAAFSFLIDKQIQDDLGRYLAGRAQDVAG